VRWRAPTIVQPQGALRANRPQLKRDPLGRPLTRRSPHTIVLAMPPIAPDPRRPLFQELGVFVVAVILGSLCGLATNELLRHWVTGTVAGNAALAVATTGTGAAHSHFVHRQSWVHLLPKVGVGAPLAYGAMRLVHAVLGS